MIGFGNLIRRNVKLFFKDKGLFFTSLITPIILLVLYVTFLAKSFREGFLSGGLDVYPIKEGLIDAVVGGQLFSSLLSVSAITVAFCANMLMVQDKVTGARNDLTVTPVKSHTLTLSYYVATVISTLLICLVTTIICFIYMKNIGWYMSAEDVACIFADVFLLTMFGTALSSVVNLFLSSQGQMQAVGTIVSAGYGFICGAYMPIASFGEGLQKVLMFLPGTYGTGLLRNHAIGGTIEEMEAQGMPEEVTGAVMDSLDCNLYFGEEKISERTMYIVLILSVVILLSVYVLLGRMRKKH